MNFNIKVDMKRSFRYSKHEQETALYKATTYGTKMSTKLLCTCIKLQHMAQIEFQYALLIGCNCQVRY